MKIALIRSNFANLYSVCNALRYLGYTAELIDRPEELEQMDKVIFPGVGSFGRVRADLESKAGLLEGMQAYLRSGRPFLGICVGMQFLLQTSHEGDTLTSGLGFIPGQVELIPTSEVRYVPHIGWNKLHIAEEHHTDPIFRDLPRENLQMYFVHSFHCVPENKEQILAKVQLSETFAASAMIRCGQVYGTQFHPEKSGELGLRLLDNFLKL